VLTASSSWFCWQEPSADLQCSLCRVSPGLTLEAPAAEPTTAGAAPASSVFTSRIPSGSVFRTAALGQIRSQHPHAGRLEYSRADSAPLLAAAPGQLLRPGYQRVGTADRRCCNTLSRMRLDKASRQASGMVTAARLCSKGFTNRAVSIRVA
jgi:hypothetical protein